MCLKIVLTVFVLVAGIPAFCQVSPQASRKGLPLTIGAGYSNYRTDLSGRLSGPVLWADWNFYGRPDYLQGFGIEVEARDLNYDRTGSMPNLRMDTATAGLIYRWRRFDRFSPYGKFLVGFGSIDFISSNPTYKHDTRTVYSPGAGLEYRLFPQVWLVANYEYQVWPGLFRNSLNPEGFTLGAAFDFRRSHRDNSVE